MLSRTQLLFRMGLISAAIVITLQGVGLALLPDPSQRVTLNSLAGLVGTLLACASSVYAAWQTRRHAPRLFPGWMALAASQIAIASGTLLSAVQSLVFESVPYPSAADLLFLSSYLLFLVMMVLLPGEDAPRLELIQVAFDAIIVALSSGLLFWQFLIAPIVLTSHAALLQVLASVAYLVGDLVALWALMILLLRRFSLQHRRPLVWLIGALGAELVYDLWSGLWGIHQEGAPFSTPMELVFTATVCMVMLACLRQGMLVAIPAVPLPRPRPWRRQLLRLMTPYLWLAAAYLALPLSLVERPKVNPLIAMSWIALIMVLVVVRQFLVMEENQRLGVQLHRLNTELEARVLERTAALALANEALREREQQLAHNALHDRLTDLPNRALLVDRLDLALRRIRRDQTYAFGVLYMDLDGFKLVNDSLGHAAGDQLLVQVAARLSGCVREVDTVARLGGDEFVILLDDFFPIEMLTQTAERVLSALALPFDLEGHLATVAASIGVVSGNLEYTAPAELLRDADMAMYEAKALGKGRQVLFTPALRTVTLDRLTLENDLRLALERGELFLQYQPIVNLRTGHQAGFEALVRWQHPARGALPPLLFIPLAEASGQIASISMWVLQEALRQLRAWHQQCPAAPLQTVSVNLSARLFDQPDLVDLVADMLAEVGLPPQALVLEITESAVAQDPAAAVKLLLAWQALGVAVHLDDFGTGYSSLSYLHQFPLQALKVDRTFVSRLQPDCKNMEIVRTIVALARDLGLEVIAEGLETEEQQACLRTLGCQWAQGYLLSPPLSAEAAGQLLAAPRTWSFPT